MEVHMKILALLIIAVFIAIDFVIGFKLLTHDYKDKISSYCGVFAFVAVFGFSVLLISKVFTALGL